MNILRTLTPGLFITLQVKAFSKSFYLQFSVAKNISHARKCWIKVNPVTIQEEKGSNDKQGGLFYTRGTDNASQNLGNIFLLLPQLRHDRPMTDYL